MSRYYAYVRVSTTKQQDGTSIAAQKKLINEYAKTNKLRIIETYEEIQSAANTHRTQFQKLITNLESGRADGLILHTIDRGARNLKDWASIGELADKGVDIRFVQENLDFNARGSRLSADIQAVIAADYIRNLRFETLKGITCRLEQGLYPFKAPLGYIDTGSGRVKEIDPVLAPYIREGFKLYSSGECSLKELANHMYAEGLRNSTGRKASPVSWSRILRNPFYYGVIHVRGKIYPGMHEQIIREGLYKKVQGVLDSRIAKKAQSHQSLFRNYAYCKECESRLLAECQKGFTYYRCHTRSHTTAVREDRLEAALQKYLVERPVHQSIRSKIVKDILSLGEKQAYLNSQKAMLSSFHTKKENLYKMYTDGIMLKNEVAQKKIGLDQQACELKRRIEQAQTKLNDLHSKEVTIGQYLQGGGGLDLSLSIKRTIFRYCSLRCIITGSISDKDHHNMQFGVGE